MAYEHGTRGEFSPTIGTVPVKSGTTAVYIGTAPVNLVSGYAEKGVINRPVEIKNLQSAKQLVGYSEDWESFTLCEATSAHFDNIINNAGPVVYINVLDPDKHKKAMSVTQELTFKNGQAIITGDKIILDTLALSDKTEGVDYQVEYDFTMMRTIIASDNISTIQASYSEVDPTAITISDIIGKMTLDGEYAGLGAIDLVYTELGKITNIIAAPGYSQKKEVYQAMVKAATKINGHWDATVNADLDVGGVPAVDSISKAIAWKTENEYTSERSKVYWPKWETIRGEVYHLSTLATWLMIQIDADHDNVPMESPSNKQLPTGRQYFGQEARNWGFDQQTANQLNEKGITTAVFWAGINVMWGPHTAAYDAEDISDNRVIFDNSLRTMMHISNSFQEEWGLTIDEPMTLALAETIKNREQEKLDALKAIGALIGTPVVKFVEADNPEENLAQGDFVWSNELTPTPPFKSGTLKVAYSNAGFESYYGGDE